MKHHARLHIVRNSNPDVQLAAEDYCVSDAIIVHHRRVIAAECRLIEALAKLELVFDRSLA